MTEDIVEKTKKTAGLYFKDVADEKPFELWRSFDKGLARDFSLFITGQMYAREKIPHKTRQLITVASLTVLSRLDELRLRICLKLPLMYVVVCVEIVNEVDKSLPDFVFVHPKRKCRDGY